MIDRCNCRGCAMLDAAGDHDDDQSVWFEGDWWNVCLLRTMAGEIIDQAIDQVDQAYEQQQKETNMTNSKTYNGHKNWNHWNVSLWVNNDQALYRAALSWLRAAGGNRRRAARAMLYALTNAGYATPATPRTPDGAPYSISALYNAMEGMEA